MSKADILRKLRANEIEPVDLPSLDDDWIRYESPRDQFCEVLGTVGGNAIIVEEIEQIAGHLEQMNEYRDANKICSHIPAVAAGNVDLSEIEDPHDLEDVDFCIAGGEFGVAENGAIWVTDKLIRHRVSLFITQHLALVVPSDAIVHNMHEAYQRISFAKSEFGVFISGPSKTADIEQSLVIGAHGPRSLTVFLVANGTASP